MATCLSLFTVIIISALILIFPSSAIGQPEERVPEDVQFLINDWNSGTDRSNIKVYKVYGTIVANRDTAGFKMLMDQLHEHRKNNKDRQIEVMTLMYEALGGKEFGLLARPEYVALAQEAIKLAIPLKNEMLNADLYNLYASTIDDPPEYLFYTLKALEIQKRLGFNKFYDVQHRLMAVSGFLYDAGHYKQSILFADEGIKLWGSDTKPLYWKIHILLLDLLGANYKMLGMPERSYAYYQEMHDSLIIKPLKKETEQLLWIGISNGNIGQHYVRNGDYRRGLQLMQDYLERAREVKDTFNIGIAQNDLGEAYFGHKEYDHAMAAWRQAAAMSANKGSYHLYQYMRANKGISSIFRIRGNTDSAVYYNEQYHNANLKWTNYKTEQGYPTAATRLVFDSLQFISEKIHFEKTESRNNRLLVAGAIALLAFTILIIYNLKNLKVILRKLKSTEMEYTSAKTEAQKATERISRIEKEIEEKEKLIAYLGRHQGKNFHQKKLELELGLQNNSLLSNDEWQEFRNEFTGYFPEFLSRLEVKAQTLTPAEERLAILMFLNLDRPRIAYTLGIGTDSVARAQRRLRQKLCPGNNDDLTKIISEL